MILMLLAQLILLQFYPENSLPITLVENVRLFSGQLYIIIGYIKVYRKVATSFGNILLTLQEDKTLAAKIVQPQIQRTFLQVKIIMALIFIFLFFQTIRITYVLFTHCINIYFEFASLLAQFLFILAFCLQLAKAVETKERFEKALN